MGLKNNKSGTILLYSLLVVSFIAAIAVTLSVIVVNELKLTSGAANATLAYYAAESGIERGLYAVKLMRNDGTSTLSSAVTEIGSFPKAGDASFENGADYSNGQTSSKTSEIINEEVIENSYIQADYYNVENPLSDAGVVQIVVSNGPDAPETNPNPDTWAEVSWTAWDSNGTLGTSTSARKVIGPTDLQPDPPADTGWPITLDVFSDQPIVPVGYRVRIKSLFGDLSSLSVIPYDGAGGQVTDLPSQLEIKSVGELSKFKQSLTATVPWKLPLHGLYDYVIFSEGDILKTVILSRPVYSSGVIQVEAGLAGGVDCHLNCEEDWEFCCQDCINNTIWDGLECFSSPTANPNVACYSSTPPGGVCKLIAAVPGGDYHEGNAWGFTLPIPDGVPEGEEYYVSLRMGYENKLCSGGECGREVAVEIGGQSAIVGDPGIDDWHTCTIPETFALGNPSLPEDDSNRTIKITVHPLGPPGNNGDDWDDPERMAVDWYQLSTYKIFPDCE